jgi:hypothetical protein
MKTILFVLLLFSLGNSIFGIEYVIVDDTVLSNDVDGNHAIYSMSKGENLDIEFDSIINTKKGLRIRTRYNGQRVWINANSLREGYSDILPERINKQKWILSFYLDVIRTREKETLFYVRSILA